MKKCSLPTHKQCFRLIEEYHVPAHIVRHGLATAKLAVFLAERLKEKGHTINAELVDRASLLHDLVRVCDFKKPDNDKFEQNITLQAKAKWQQIRKDHNNIPHEYIAYELLKEKYPLLAIAIRKHRYVSLLDEKEKPRTWEEKLLYYADKRVMHDKIVPLKQRLNEAHKRNIFQNGSSVQYEIKTAKVDALIYELEQQIFNELEFNPDDVTEEFIESFTSSNQSKD